MKSRVPASAPARILAAAGVPSSRIAGTLRKLVKIAGIHPE